MQEEASKDYRSTNRKLAAIYLFLLFTIQASGILVILIFELYRNLVLFFVIGIIIATIAPVLLGYLIFKKR